MRRLLVVLVLLVSACGSSRLTGELGERTATFGFVDRVLVGDALVVDVRIEPGSETFVEITADTGVIDEIALGAVNGSLEVAAPDTAVRDAEISVVVPDLKALVVDSAAAVRVAGPVDRLLVDATGAAQVDLRDVDAASIDIDARAGAAVDVGVVDQLSGIVLSGAGLRVATRPVMLDVSVGGTAFLIVVDEEPLSD